MMTRIRYARIVAGIPIRVQLPTPTAVSVVTADPSLSTQRRTRYNRHGIPPSSPGGGLRPPGPSPRTHYSTPSAPNPMPLPSASFLCASAPQREKKKPWDGFRLGLGLGLGAMAAVRGVPTSGWFSRGGAEARRKGGHPDSTPTALRREAQGRPAHRRAYPGFLPHPACDNSNEVAASPRGACPRAPYARNPSRGWLKQEKTV
jgi:hypothetical protein